MILGLEKLSRQKYSQEVTLYQESVEVRMAKALELGEPNFLKKRFQVSIIFHKLFND